MNDKTVANQNLETKKIKGILKKNSGVFKKNKRIRTEIKSNIYDQFQLNDKIKTNQNLQNLKHQKETKNQKNKS